MSVFESRWYQVEAEQAIFDYYDNGGRGNPVIAMPTGTGKSHVIANALLRIFRFFPGTRAMMLTHVKELIEQNAKKVLEQWPLAPLGIFSAGLNRKDMMLPITFAGVMSLKKVVRQFGFIHVLFVDECHLISDNDASTYHMIIAALMEINPNLRIIGFTATPFRMKQGLITEGDNRIFTDIIYDITGYEAFNRLVADGFISPLVSGETTVHIDLSDVGLVGGDFNNKELAAASDIEKITHPACIEICNRGEHRASWLTFGTSVEHTEHIAEKLRNFGIVAAAAHSKLTGKENDARLAAFKRGEIRCLVNMGKFTTGVDHPPIDLIALLRATNSPGLMVQMLGRGTRPFAGNYIFPPKRNCLALDFARNIERLGPINDPRIPSAPKGGGGDAPIRICQEGFRTVNGEKKKAIDGCGAYNHPKVKFCDQCNMEFNFAAKVVSKASNKQPMRSDEPELADFKVSRVLYKLHEKRNAEGDLISPPSVKVTYICGFQMFYEWIGLEHKSVRWRAKEWWKLRAATEPPANAHEALERISELREPSYIRVHVNKRPYPEIESYEF